MRDAFNAAGPWQWQLRDSDFYGSYLNCRPQPGLRLRVHRQIEIWRGEYRGGRENRLLALLEIDAASTISRPEIDVVFQRLLAAVGATDVTEIEPYD
jgi:hypothetical protein